MIRKRNLNKKSTSSLLLKMIYYFLQISFMLVTVYILFFSPFLKINRINIGGVQELSSKDISDEVRSLIGKKYFSFIPADNLILISKNQIENELKKKFVKISAVEIKKVFPDNININIKERKSLIVWCMGEIVPGKCYIADDGGYAYIEADFESPEIKENHLIEIIDSSSRQVQKGENILSSDYLDFILKIKENILQTTGINIQNQYMTPARISEEIYLQTENGWEIRLSSRIPLEKSIRTLKTFLDKNMVADFSRLEYVDLRAENKVYYKLKNSEKPVPDEEKKFE